ncbi:MAG: hypothetical protein EA369_03610 [Bradymonadales bacterium]|nr:MAG: hypothetical protein EA369_03610 [Bradymonadales bacterium]
MSARHHFSLVCFEENSDYSVQLSLHVRAKHATARFELTGDFSKLQFEVKRKKAEFRRELWRSSCFELFFLFDDQKYWEYNFSPDTAYWHQSFHAYRKEDHPSESLKPSRMSFSQDSNERVLFETEIELAQTPLGFQAAAILHESSGQMLHFALRHPSSKPDFHSPNCFESYPTA